MTIALSNPALPKSDLTQVCGCGRVQRAPFRVWALRMFNLTHTVPEDDDLPAKQRRRCDIK